MVRWCGGDVVVVVWCGGGGVVVVVVWWWWWWWVGELGSGGERAVENGGRLFPDRYPSVRPTSCSLPYSKHAAASGVRDR